MHPAASVIVFTTLSGAGYGLLFWFGLLRALDVGVSSLVHSLSILAVGFVLVAIGLFASLAHLGRPERAWMAFSQWRSSWLSREGVIAVVSVVIVFAFAFALWWPLAAIGQTLLALMLSLTAVLTVYCTARIYSSLKPIPAWHNDWVVPNYLLFAAATGAAWLWLLAASAPAIGVQRIGALVASVLLLALAITKVAYWRHIDRTGVGVDAAAALGLPAGSRVTPFEAPHTQANFLMKEMGYALARKHGRRLRRAVIGLLCLPVVLLWLAAWNPSLRAVAGPLVVLMVMAAAVVERWLFFAQARHVVMTYYDARPS
jgi:DMSO reductase anchor subunit